MLCSFLLLLFCYFGSSSNVWRILRSPISRCTQCWKTCSQHFRWFFTVPFVCHRMGAISGKTYVKRTLNSEQYTAIWHMLQESTPIMCIGSFQSQRTITCSTPIINPTKEADCPQKVLSLPCICSSNARHILETLKGGAELNATQNAGIIQI